MYILAIAATVLLSCEQKASKNASNPDATAKEIGESITDIKTYVIEYKMVMSAKQVKSTTTMTQWIDMKNDRFAMESTTDTEMMGTKQSGKSLIIDDGNWSYFIDLANKTAYKSKSGEAEDDPTELLKSDDDVTFRQMIEKEGGKVLANETFLGKNCIVVEMIDKDEDENGQKSKMWYYKGVPLKIASVTYTMVATKFEENVSIPSAKFELPKGITVSELPSNMGM